MAIMKREPGLMGLAKQKAKRQGMYQVPKRYQPQGGEEEYPVFVTKEEMALLKKQGGSGHMTPFGIPSFDKDVRGTAGTRREEKRKDAQRVQSGDTSSRRLQDINRGRDSGSGNRKKRKSKPKKAKKTYSLSYDKSKSLMENIERIDVGGWLKSLKPAERPPDIRFETDPKKIQDYLRNNPEKAKDAVGKMGGPEAKAAMDSPEAKKAEAYAKDRQEDYEKGQSLTRQREEATIGRMKDASGKFEGEAGYDASTAKRDITDSFEGYKQQAKGLGAESKELTKGFGEDVTKLQGYQSQFDTMAKDAKTRGDTAETDYGDAAETGAGKLEGVGEDARETFDAGAEDVGTVKDQFGKEGFQKDIRGMSEAALDSDLGQRDAELLKGRMEEQRMASTKGSEEKLRRELAQSGASPAEIAAKVAQFQSQQATSQSQAGRSEALQANIQGRQMGQQSLSQAAQLKGQEAGMAGKQAGLAVQQAQLKGQGLAMEGQMAQAGAGMRMQGIQTGAQLGFQGADQQASMMGQGIGAVQAAGAARQQQMGGLDQQGQFIDQQGGYTQSQLADVVAQETQAYQEEQARLTRSAQGTPDDPRWRPPEQTAAVMPATGGLPPGTTTAQPPPTMVAGGPPGRPGMQARTAGAGIAQPGGIMGQPTDQVMAERKRKQLAAGYATA